MAFYFDLRVILTVCAVLTACSTTRNVDEYGSWTQSTVHTDRMFDLIYFAPEYNVKHETLTIFIEGDGSSWRSRTQPSNNTTPNNPVALKLAIKNQSSNSNTVYLARPCQYIDLKTQPYCNYKYWTSHRFSEEIVESTNEAINILKDNYKADKIELVGYSGGGAIAALLSARRQDIIKLTTVAGNLDTDAWTSHHNISPLSGSLNPADYWKSLLHIPQTHYVGNNDRIIPPFITQSYVDRFPETARPEIIIIDKVDHNCCWDILLQSEH